MYIVEKCPRFYLSDKQAAQPKNILYSHGLSPLKQKLLRILIKKEKKKLLNHLAYVPKRSSIKRRIHIYSALEQSVKSRRRYAVEQQSPSSPGVHEYLWFPGAHLMPLAVWHVISKVAGESYPCSSSSSSFRVFCSTRYRGRFVSPPRDRNPRFFFFFFTFSEEDYFKMIFLADQMGASCDYLTF